MQKGEIVRLETEKQIGIISASILTVFIVCWNYSKTGTVILPIDVLLLVGYVLALVFKKVIIAEWMFAFFVLFNLMLFRSLPSEILKEPKKYTFVWVFTIVVLGIFIFLLGLGIRGVKRIIEKEGKSEENLLRPHE